MPASVILYLGSDMGQWVLSRIRPSDVRAVVAESPELHRAAAARGFTVWSAANAGGADVALSVHYPRILTGEELSRYSCRYNLHPGYLPWGRGYYPVFWALWEQTPAGATLHEMIPKVDAGPIIDQLQVPVADHDTGYSLFVRVRAAERRLFRDYWPRILRGEVLTAGPQTGTGSSHTRAEFCRLQRPASIENLSATALLRLARAMTFPGHPGLTVSSGGHACELLLRLVPEAALCN